MGKADIFSLLVHILKIHFAPYVPILRRIFALFWHMRILAKHLATYPTLVCLFCPLLPTLHHLGKIVGTWCYSSLCISLFKDGSSILSTNQLVGLGSNYYQDFPWAVRVTKEHLWQYSNLHTRKWYGDFPIHDMIEIIIQKFHFPLFKHTQLSFYLVV